jgi:hypothetical protein
MVDIPDLDLLKIDIRVNFAIPKSWRLGHRASPSLLVMAPKFGQPTPNRTGNLS